MHDEVECENHVALYISVSPSSRGDVLDPAYRAIRRMCHAFVWTREDGYCLYDDVEDPYQLRNLADMPETVALQERMKRELEKIADSFGEKEYYSEKWGYGVDTDGNVPYSRYIRHRAHERNAASFPLSRDP